MNAKPIDTTAATASLEKRRIARTARLWALVKYAVLAVIILVILFPLLWIISLGFRIPDEVLQIFPTRFTLKNISETILRAEVWAGLPFFRMYGNSVLVTGISIAGIMVVASLAAFGFSHFRFRGKETIFITLLLSFMIPVQVMLIPLFFLMKTLGLLTTYLVLILPYISFGFPIAVLILRGFFAKIPAEITEAAVMDGMRDFGIFTRIILPLARPALATVITFSFMGVWNEFAFALVFIRKDYLMTIPLVLNRMAGGQYKIMWEMYGAMVFLTVIPVIIIYIIFQKWFIAGLSEGAIKG